MCYRNCSSWLGRRTVRKLVWQVSLLVGKAML